VSPQPLQYALSRMDDMDKVAFSGLHRDWQGADTNPLVRR